MEIEDQTPSIRDNGALVREDGDEDEFVVIRESAEHTELFGQPQQPQSARYTEKSSEASEYGSNSVADVGDGLSVGGTKTPFNSGINSVMNSSVASLSNPQPTLMDSTYMSFYPFENTTKVDNLIECLQESRGEQEKYGTMLSQIHSMLLLDLNKEKGTKSELRAKCDDYEKELEGAQQAVDELKKQLSIFKVEKEREIGKLKEDVHMVQSELEMKDGMIANLQQKLSLLSDEKAELEGSLTECSQQLELKKKESENQAEIINVLHDECTESKRFFDESRNVYRERLNQLEAQVAAMYERNEVNFPGC